MVNTGRTFKFLCLGNAALASAKWQSVYQHITNHHSNFDSDVYPACQHGEMEEDRDWLPEGKNTFCNSLYL
jgi:hypothetical protein